MSNDSSTGGYLTPAVSPAPSEDAALDAIFQAAVAGITGLAGNLVRPRWQATMPKQPEPSVDWCAIGVTIVVPDAGPFIQHDGSVNGHDNYTRHEEIDLATTFYGPGAGANAARLRDGLCIAQNIEALRLAGIAYIECGQFVAVPEIFNQQWIRRVDITARFRRMVTRQYGILNILSADPILIADDIGIITN